MQTYIICADGACSGNPGPGGFAWEIWTEEVVAGNEITAGAGLSHDTTNNIMELNAAIGAFEAVRDLIIEGRMDARSKLMLRFDSEYVLNGIEGWIETWKRRGWRTASNKPVKNLELWQKMDALLDDMNFRQMTLKADWVKGHSGNMGNERVDAKAVEMRDLAKEELRLKEQGLSAPSETAEDVVEIDIMALAETAGADTYDAFPPEEQYDPSALEVLKGLEPAAPRDTRNIVGDLPDDTPSEITPDQVQLMSTILDLYKSGDYGVKKVIEEVRANAIALGCR